MDKTVACGAIDLSSILGGGIPKDLCPSDWIFCIQSVEHKEIIQVEWNLVIASLLGGIIGNIIFSKYRYKAVYILVCCGLLLGGLLIIFSQAKTMILSGIIIVMTCTFLGIISLVAQRYIKRISKNNQLRANTTADT